ncbi:NAD(P)/FAD-dependent oxidoreductase [Rhodococcus artemisiae]|uniref:NAD(P)/FAD-dependent oxidoreductase n=1 Tax=Rhodococcus artemisiae TaxID=714159 RepID=A0ABU7LBE7_9NOCA|nr:NAD(P)/FAD-dependent oxidoreductase [Rhodococcus artemisiae]MEE2058840.1 NAD(P)/FAD-dependent oxidoreductase [Rhodococcus artemisiae]
MTASYRVLVLGSGFAGLWSALGAARRLDELDAAGTVDVTVISAQPFHDIRVRNYEADLSACRIPLRDLLDPVDVGHIAAEVTAIDTETRTVTVSDHGTPGTQSYDRLVMALGSRVATPDIPGLREFGFDVDTYDGAMKLQRHLAALSDGTVDTAAAAATAVVVGAGLTGIETASELPGRLAKVCAGRNVEPRVVLIDHNPYIGSDMGASARPVIQAALSDNGVETMTGVGVAAVDEHGVTLSFGDVVAAGTVIWCAGMRANPLTAQLSAERDRLGRLPVDDYLQVIGSPGVFAAGDVAAARVDDDHLSVMSCQHGRPMGRYAGYNVIGDLLEEPMMPLRIPWYTTILDLGAAGAVYTEGWGRQVIARGARAKATKVTINTRRIYPPLNRDRNALLAAAAPVLQERPDPGR